MIFKSRLPHESPYNFAGNCPLFSRGLGFGPKNAVHFKILSDFLNDTGGCFFPTCVAVVISIFVRSFLKMGDPKSCLDPPSHHRFQYQVMVVHNLDDLGYPHDLLWMVAKSESPVENGGLYHYRVSTIPNWWFLGFRWPIHRRKPP